MPEWSHKLRFLLGNKPVELDFSTTSSVGPSTTVLNYLRAFPGFKGVKEGCAEGDCGACTVVIASPDGRGSMDYKAVNSCLVFLPMLEGKQLITVEHLSGEHGLHPVQQWMVDHYGSQCGFCTPGIIMSLFALYKSGLSPTRENAVRMLSGNLCRCTGYTPILEVAMKALSADGTDHFSSGEAGISLLLSSWPVSPLHLYTARQHYFKPFSLSQALEVLQQHPECSIASGATDLALKQSKKHEFIPEILDISSIEELDFWEEHEHEWIIGSGTPIEKLWTHLRGTIPLFDELFSVFASHQIRNLATLGGNIASASPIGDTLPVMIALDARLELCSKEGSRILTLEEFITGYRKTQLKQGELIKSILIPKPPLKAIFRFYKVSKRRELDISTVSLAARLEKAPDGSLEKVILAFGGMAEVPKRAVKTESLLKGELFTRSLAERAAMHLQDEFHPISDARATKEARALMARNLILKLFLDTSETGGKDE